MTDYRKLRFNNINSPEFKHLFLLIYWPLYGLLFWFLEKGVLALGIAPEYTPIVSDLDAKIPFCEYFMIPYLLWFAYLVWIHAHTLFFDVPQFKKLMYFIMITYSTTIIVYVLFPNMQELRPTEFPRDNIFTEMVRRFYIHDTNTNVCPSLHVIGSFAVLFASWNSKWLKSLPVRIINVVLTVAISISTVFLKQHSIIDIYAGLAVCAIAWPIAYILPDKIAAKKALQSKVDKKEKITAKK